MDVTDQTLSRRNKQGHWLLSKRWTVAYIGFLGSVALYLMRVNSSIAVVCMTTDVHSELEDNSTIPTLSEEYLEFMKHLDAYCPNYVESGKADSLSGLNESAIQLNSSAVTGKFTWSRQLRGWVLSSFYVTYVPFQLPSAWLARKFGAKKVILAGGIMDTIATFLSPVAARSSVYLLMVMQGFKGLGHAAFHPCMHHLWSTWAPTLERTTLAVFVLSGNTLGSILAFAISGYLCEFGFAGGWPSLYYVCGMFACLWLLLWQLLVFDSPEDHPRISDEERNYLLKSTGVNKCHADNMSVPWLSIARSSCVWVITVADFCAAWMFYVFLTTLPQYMKDILRFDIKQNGLFTALPHVIALIFSILFSFLMDTIRSHHITSTTNVRRLAGTVDLLLPVALVIPLGFLDCTQYITAVILLCVAVPLGTANRSGPGSNMIDIAPRYAGILMGISNTISSIAGFLAPLVVAALTSTGLPSGWRNVFFVSAGVQAFGWLAYMIFCRGEVQPWAHIEGYDPNIEPLNIELSQTDDKKNDT